jgi:hypothetical protein
LEQYKLFIEMADRVSSRRATTNQFYVTLLSGLLAVAAFILKEGVITHNQNIVLLSLSSLGIIICIFWGLNLLSYRQLNSGKFKVIHEMEKLLPFQCYDREWEILDEGKNWKKYLPLTHIEIYIPITISSIYIALLIYSLYLLIN